MTQEQYRSAEGSNSWHDPLLEIELDLGGMNLAPDVLDDYRDLWVRSVQAMAALESGAVANPDEGRQVGHYWLRAPELAPDPAQTEAIRTTADRVERFAADVLSGGIRPPRGDRFTDFLLIGIGGSALGPQLVSDALGAGGLTAHYLDNTDPGGMDRVFDALRDRRETTLVVVVSKSGGTRETRNGLLETEAFFGESDLPLGPRAVAVTGEGSALERTAHDQGFLATFPMWDWVGGRTSICSAVGLLPMALEGIDVRGFLEGAREMDVRTRRPDLPENPAGLLAAVWHHAGSGRGDRDMVVLPYKDRLQLFSRYLQQLVMESLGKRCDRAGSTVHQGLVVYGNKGSTDQHAYVQQLREGPDNFFVTFLGVREDRAGRSIAVAPDTTAGDYLLGFLLGTRRALSDAGRLSLTLMLPRVSARSLGHLIALYERAVGFYAEWIDINAYHQPGVEAGKKAAEEVLERQRRALGLLRAEPGRGWTVDQLVAQDGELGDPRELWFVLRHAASNPDHGVEETAAEPWWETSFRSTPPPERGSGER